MLKSKYSDGFAYRKLITKVHFIFLCVNAGVPRYVCSYVSDIVFKPS